VLVLVFSYDAREPEHFEYVYGPDGEWARFFRGVEGYERTELLRSETSYLVIDRWRSAAAYDAFVGTHADEYQRRNDAAAALYRHEEFLGRFESAA